MVRYLECQKNHAAQSGGHVLDGCCEFMPAGEEGTPLGLKCEACDCHRSFHRREADVATAPPAPASMPNCYNISFTNNNSKPSAGPVISPNSRQLRTPVMMAFGSSANAESSSEGRLYGSSKKRFRTKFTSEQKEKMVEFADRIGWRIHKQQESELRRFCLDAGVDRQVFKVWLHNNKQLNNRKHS